ncbi:MAG: PilN domain-containing protein [Methylococcales bacterium]|nr:PilN domain-containing protein [Methylococcales bacterium]
MAKINLLPWREELRKKKQEEFIAAIGAGVLVTCVLFALVYFYIEELKQYQQLRNTILTNEIKVVDKKIEEIKDIEAKKRKLLTKIDVIHELQKSRPQIVHLFDELAKVTPEGIFLNKFKQSGKNLSFTGKAQSNARVSAYMRGVDGSDWLQSPLLQVIKGKGQVKDGALSDFSMLAKQGEKKLKEDKK